jgi:hypothetical protein
MRLVKPTTKTIDLGDGEYIVVAADISKRTFNNLVAEMPQDIGEEGMTPKQGTEFQKAVFSAFVKGWSVQDEDGNDLPAEAEHYLDLPNEYATKIDNALLEHFNAVTVGPEDSKKPATSRAR